MRQRAAIVVLAGLVLSGCSLFQADRPTIVVDYGAAALVYADAKAAYVLLAKAVTDACAVGKLSAPTCTEAAKIHERVQMTDEFLRSGLQNPARPVDWEKVTALLVSVLGLAMKMAL